MAVLCSRYAQGIFPRIVNHKRHIQHKNNVDLASSTFKSLTSTNTCIILSCYQSTDVLRSSGSLFLPNSFKHQFKSNTSRLLNTFCSAISNFTSVRPFSLSCKNASKDPNYPYTSKNEELMLMEFPQTIWPSVIYTIKNWILATLIIRPYMDRDFSLDEFSRGAKKVCISAADFLKLSRGSTRM